MRELSKYQYFRRYYSMSSYKLLLIMHPSDICVDVLFLYQTSIFFFKCNIDFDYSKIIITYCWKCVVSDKFIKRDNVDLTSCHIPIFIFNSNFFSFLNYWLIFGLRIWEILICFCMKILSNKLMIIFFCNWN